MGTARLPAADIPADRWLVGSADADALLEQEKRYRDSLSTLNLDRFVSVAGDSLRNGSTE